MSLDWGYGVSFRKYMLRGRKEKRKKKNRLLKLNIKKNPNILVQSVKPLSFLLCQYCHLLSLQQYGQEI